MPDFDVRVAGGVELRRWADPVGPDGEPSRVRPHPGHDQLYYLGKLARGVLIKCAVGGVEGLPDSALGGRLFAAYLSEGFGPGSFTAAAGFTSTILWTPTNAGHHLVGIRRPDGGAYLIPFDIAP
jgi:hypothetical protein